MATLDDPETRYVVNDRGRHLAYQVFGSGPTDVVFIPAFFSHIELMWDEPTMASFLRRLATFARVAIFDPAGSGLSDPVDLDDLPGLDGRVDDVVTVAAAASFERFSIVAATAVGPVAVRLATRRPEIVGSLVLFNTAACNVRKDGYDLAAPSEVVERWSELRRRNWGRAVAPTMRLAADQSRLARWIPRYQRFSAAPGAAEALYREALDWDVREELGVVRAETLVLHRSDNAVIRPANGRYLAEHIPSARYVELPGSDSNWSIDPSEPVLDEIQRFLTRDRPEPSGEQHLVTVLFTDVVGSTALAAATGNERWGDLLEAHHRLSRDLVERHSGDNVKSTGDGIVATFSRPSRAVECATSLLQRTEALLGLQLRAGIHAGECTLRGGDVGGLSVHIAARIVDLAPPSRVVVSQTVRDLLVGSAMRFAPAGTYELRGVPGQWQLFEVAAPEEMHLADGGAGREDRFRGTV